MDILQTRRSFERKWYGFILESGEAGYTKEWNWFWIQIAEYYTHN